MLAISMFFIMHIGRPFFYEKIQLHQSMDVFDISVSELPSLNPDFRRFIRILEDNGIHTTSDMTVKYLACEFGDCYLHAQ